MQCFGSSGGKWDSVSASLQPLLPEVQALDLGRWGGGLKNLLPSCLVIMATSVWWIPQEVQETLKRGGRWSRWISLRFDLKARRRSLS